MKSAVVIYDSRFGYTGKIAKALAEGMKKGEITVDFFKVGDVEVSKLRDYDVLAVGGPTHLFGISKPMKEFLKNLEQVDLKGKKAFAIDTKLKGGRFSGSAGKGIEKKLKQLNMKIVKSYASGIVKGNKGPLQEGMEETFKQVGVDLAKS